jgi:4-hydroxy-4-methyl-2-oxoglutarate aldolase
MESKSTTYPRENETATREQRKQVSIYPEVQTQNVSRQRKAELLAMCDEFKALTGGSAACADALDFLGYRRASMGPEIKPFFPDKGRMCGLAYTIRGCNVIGLPPVSEEVREVVDVEYYDSIEPGYVLMYGTHTAEGGTIVGDVISTIASMKGAVGCVCDGPVRDLERIKPLNFLPFGPSAAPPSGEGRVLWIEYNCIIQVGGVWVEPFDIVFGDMDGVVIIPKHLAEQVLARAKEICDKEDAIKADYVRNPNQRLYDLFKRHNRRV